MEALNGECINCFLNNTKLNYFALLHYAYCTYSLQSCVLIFYCWFGMSCLGPVRRAYGDAPLNAL